MQIIIPGRIPSKKNSRLCFVRGGRPVNISSRDYRDWHERARLAIAPQIIKQQTIGKAQSVTIIFYMADNRGRDLTNVAESVMDLLVDLRVIKDDQWQVTGPVNLLPGGVDRDNPRAEVFINT